MSIFKRINRYLNRNNPELISEEIAQVFHKRKENGEKDPMDNTVKDIMKILKQHPDIERAILANIAENEKIPDKIFEKAATEISKDEEIPDSIITDVVKKADVDIPDETINNIIEEGKVDLKERIDLLKNVEDKDILKTRVKNELKILYRTCNDKKDNEVTERIKEIEGLLKQDDIDEEIKNGIQTVIAKKMAENYYEFRGTRIFTLSKVMPVEEMIERDIPETVKNEYEKIEEEQGAKEVKFNKKELTRQILLEMASQIGTKSQDTGVFIVPQSENLKKIDEKERIDFIKTIQIYAKRQLTKEEIVDIDEQLRGASNNIQIKENTINNLIKKIPKKDKIRKLSVLIDILQEVQAIETIGELKESGLLEQLSKMPEEARKETMDAISKTVSKRKTYNIVKNVPRVNGAKFNTNSKSETER